MAGIPYADSTYITCNALLGLDFSSTDKEYIDDLAEVASRMIDDYTQQTFCPQTITDEKKEAIVDFKGRLIIRTQFKPINSVTALKLTATPSEEVDIDVTQLDIHAKQGYIKVYPFGASTRTSLRNTYDFNEWNTEISYTAGPATVPSPIKRACSLLVRNMLRPGDLSAGVSETPGTNKGSLTKVKSMSYEEHYATDGGLSKGFEMSVIAEKDFLFTSDVRVILAPYAKRGVL